MSLRFVILFESKMVDLTYTICYVFKDALGFWGITDGHEYIVMTLIM